MDTSPLFNFIEEIRTFRNDRIPTSVLYEMTIRELQERFERALFQCAVENKRFISYLPIIRQYLTDSIPIIVRRGNNIERLIQRHPIHSNIVRFRINHSCIQVVNFLVKLIDEVYLHSSVQDGITYSDENNERSIKELIGVKGLSNYLHCSVDTGLRIIESGILIENGIQKTDGKSLRFNVNQLEEYLYDIPSLK